MSTEEAVTFARYIALTAGASVVAVHLVAVASLYEGCGTRLRHSCRQPMRRRAAVA